MKKYEFIEVPITVEGKTLYQIRALRDFGNEGNVKKVT